MTETKQIKHIHTVFDGTITGLDIKKISDPNLHWHEVSQGENTSTDAYGINHTHEYQGDITSKPININSDEDIEMNIQHEDEDDDDNKSFGKNKTEVKYFGGEVCEVKEESVNGVPVGIVKGYIATWALDRGNDRFVKGAFHDSLIELRAQNRPIRLKDHHFRTIGGFPIDRAFEDDKGLFAVGHINLEVQQGREAFSLAKQGVLSDFSVMFSVVEFEMDNVVRIIKKAILWEGSLVDEPMNPEAQITEVKAVVPFQDMKISDRDRVWDSSSAISRIRELTKSDEHPTTEYKKAFVWFDATESDKFGAYKLPIADVISGRMTVIPKAIFSAAAALQGARGGVDLPEIDRPKVIRHIERYYAKMDIESPFDEKQYFVANDVKKWTAKDLERFLRSSGSMSKNASKIIASCIGSKKENVEEDEKNDKQKNTSSWNNVLDELKSIKA